MKDKVNGLPEVVIPKGYRLDEMLDFEGDLWDEKGRISQRRVHDCKEGHRRSKTELRQRQKERGSLCRKTAQGGNGKPCGSHRRSNCRGRKCGGG